MKQIVPGSQEPIDTIQRAERERDERERERGERDSYWSDGGCQQTKDGARRGNSGVSSHRLK